MLTTTLPTILPGPASGKVPAKAYQCLSYLNSSGSGISHWLGMPRAGYLQALSVNFKTTMTYSTYVGLPCPLPIFSPKEK